MSLWNYLFKMHIRNKLPHLQKTMINRDRSLSVEDDARQIMMSGFARDEYAATHLLEQHKLPLPDLLRLLGKPRRADWRKRLMSRLRTLEGSYPHNPHGKEMRALRREEKIGSKHWM